VKEPPQDVVAAIQEWSQQIDEKLKQGICPQCKKPGITRQEDGRSAGVSKVQGVWVKYRCGSCGYCIDCKEPAQSVT
jgi:predicted RNA-binding Zn-ribbon protein involved in translation (DUF1610 family)